MLLQSKIFNYLSEFCVEFLFFIFLKKKLFYVELILNHIKLFNIYIRVLTKLKTLERIEFAQNGINSEGFSDLFNSFKENTNLRIINVEDNTIKSSVDFLIKALPSLKKLQVLKISDCLLTGKESVELFEALKDHENMKAIECNYNEIEDPDMQEKIFAIIIANKNQLKNLKKLSLKGNEIDKDLYEKYNKEIQKYIDEFVAYSDEELEADQYSETEEDEFGNLRKMKELKIK